MFVTDNTLGRILICFRTYAACCVTARNLVPSRAAEPMQLDFPIAAPESRVCSATCGRYHGLVQAFHRTLTKFNVVIRLIVLQNLKVPGHSLSTRPLEATALAPDTGVGCLRSDCYPKPRLAATLCCRRRNFGYCNWRSVTFQSIATTLEELESRRMKKYAADGVKQINMVVM